MTAREHRAIAWHPDSKELSWLKALLFSLALIPFGYLVQAAWAGDLGTQPAEFIQRRTGFWTFSFLLLTLSISPLRSLTQWHWLLRLRRMLGLFAFFYAALHALSFVGFQHAFAVDEIARDISKRPFIAIGFAAFVLLTPLAATSNQVAIRQLGGSPLAGIAPQHLSDRHFGSHPLPVAKQGRCPDLANRRQCRTRRIAWLENQGTAAQGHTRYCTDHHQAATFFQAAAQVVI